MFPEVSPRIPKYPSSLRASWAASVELLHVPEYGVFLWGLRRPDCVLQEDESHSLVRQIPRSACGVLGTVLGIVATGVNETAGSSLS